MTCLLNQLSNMSFTGKANINKILLIAFFIYSVSLIYYSLFLTSPVVVGDGQEYLGMTVSFFNHLTPDLLDQDIALREAIENRNGINYTSDFIYYGYFKSLSGAYYSYHFWIYSLFNLPVFAFLHYLSLNELRCFQITNSLLLIFSLFIILIINNLPGFQRAWLFLLSASSPIILYIRWPHPEVFSYSFIVIAIALYLSNHYRLAVLASSIASLQNPPIAALTIFLIISGWRSADLRIRELFILSACSLISASPYVFYYLFYHVPSLVVYSGAANIQNISLAKALSLFFDLNFGIIMYTPVLLLLSISMLVASLIRRNMVIPSLWAVLVFMAVLSSTQGNWNSGMMYINRYSVWMVPVIALTCIHDVPKPHAKMVNLLLAISFVSTSLIAGYCFYEYDFNYCKFNVVSKEVLINLPGFYNSPYDVFAERSIGGEFNFQDFMPIVFTYDGSPRKILTSSKDLDLLNMYMGYTIDKTTYEKIKRSDMGYINFENKLYPFPYDGSKVKIYDKSNYNQFFKEWPHNRAQARLNAE